MRFTDSKTIKHRGSFQRLYLDVFFCEGGGCATVLKDVRTYNNIIKKILCWLQQRISVTEYCCNYSTFLLNKKLS